MCIRDRRITATNGFPIKINIDNSNLTFVNTSSDNIPNSYFSYTFDTSTDIVTISHPEVRMSRNLAPTIVLNEASVGSHPLMITSYDSTSVSFRLNTISDLVLNSVPSCIIYRQGTYTVPIDVLEATGNYWISGRGQSKERINVLHLNQENTASFDQPHTLQGEFTIEFGVNNIQSGIIQSMLGHSTSTVGDNTFFFNGTRPFLTLNGITFGDAITIDAIEEVDNFIRLRRDTANDIFIKLNDNPETFMGNSDYTWTIDEIFKGAQGSAHIGYIRNLRIGDEYYNFAEKTGLTGASVYNSGNNPRTFTVVQGNEERAIWGTL